MNRVVVFGLILLCNFCGIHGLQIKATCDNTMYFYVDGVEYSSPNKGDWTKIDTINVPSNGNVFGIKCVNSGGPGAIIMSTDDGRWSNTQDWKCTNAHHSGWTTRNFDDSNWATPVDFGKLGAQIWSVVSGINGNAHWIWTPGGTINQPSDPTVYCRTNIKVHGKWSQWTSWSSCSKSCATGSQSRTRSCSDPAPAYGGDNCPGSSGSPQTQNCNTHNCPIHGGWSSYSAYTSCVCPSNTYSGQKSRTRTCTNPTPQYNGNSCSGSGTQTASCNCPRNGGWSAYGAWASCTKSCGSGTKTRTRTCTNPTKAYGGADCSGASSETASCNTQACPVHGNWGSWSATGSCDCSAQQALGVRTYTRQCNNPAPLHNGNQCATNIDDGTKTETDCPCDIDGGWANWGQYGSCSATCGVRTKTRTRTCTNPPKANNGADCAPPASETIDCPLVHCPINGNWGAWSAVAGSCDCSAQTALGVQTYKRQCDNPAPQYNGNACPTNIDDDTKTETDCNCDIDGGWALWGSYGSCSATCGVRIKTRTRTCSNPPQANNGADCAPPGSESVNCTWVDCPVHGGWSAWQDAANCDCTQDAYDGTRSQSRECNNPTPRFNGADCNGTNTNTVYCNCITEIPGHDIFNYTRNASCSEVQSSDGTTGSLSSCHFSCHQDDSCVAFVYIQNDNKPCYLLTGCTPSNDASDDSVRFIKTVFPPSTTTAESSMGGVDARTGGEENTAMTAAAVGGAIAGLAGLAALMILIAMRRRKKKKDEEEAAKANAFQQSNATTGATEANDATVEDFNADSSW